MTQRLREPPEVLPALADDHVATLPAGTRVMRAHDVGGRHPRQAHEPRWFGPLAGKGRFDHHPAGPPADHEPNHGVVYAAIVDPGDRTEEGVTALDLVCSELVQDGHVLVVTPGLTLSVLALTKPLELLDLTSSWARTTRAGIHLSSAPHVDTQPWARAIRHSCPDLHGVWYSPATGGPGRALTLNETAVPALATTLTFQRAFGDRALLSLIGVIGERLRFTITLT